MPSDTTRSEGSESRGERPDPALAGALLELGAATLGESGGLPMGPEMKAAWAGARLAAPAFTVRCARADNLAVHVAVTRAPGGAVLVVDAAEEPGRGYWGEVLTTAAEAAGLAGLVIDGGVRDVSALQVHGFPVFSTLVALRGAQKVGPGAIGAPVEVAGVEVRTGDWLVGDADGVAVVPAAQLTAVLEAGRVRAAKETAMFEALRGGRTTMELLNLDPGAISES